MIGGYLAKSTVRVRKHGSSRYVGSNAPRRYTVSYRGNSLPCHSCTEISSSRSATADFENRDQLIRSGCDAVANIFDVAYNRIHLLTKPKIGIRDFGDRWHEPCVALRSSWVMYGSATSSSGTMIAFVLTVYETRMRQSPQNLSLSPSWDSLCHKTSLTNVLQIDLQPTAQATINY